MSQKLLFLDRIDQRADTFPKLDSISFELREFNVLYPSTPIKYYQKCNSLKKRTSGNIEKMNKLLFRKTTLSLCYIQGWRCCSAFQLFNKSVMLSISLDSFNDIKTFVGEINCLLPNFHENRGRWHFCYFIVLCPAGLRVSPLFLFAFALSYDLFAIS